MSGLLSSANDVPVFGVGDEIVPTDPLLDAADDA
eukprot:CAMPEP_0170190330 /NCGR_PEP_ID=MMETSP0040_2-20121228/49117_1 /TAXON_ID=641309 /ORGANISM="Lotharella oceanica, Strain CCMP622" /LENGTH=33 /DNA_ID= /DNA_START= /DNA_END= /DNA_ORIENTATION=